MNWWIGRVASEQHEIVTRGEEETAAAGESLAGDLAGGDAVLLYGDLGAGKTAFVRGLARGLAAPPDAVSSPTFTLIQEYRGRVMLYHADLYRLKPIEVSDLGLDELLETDAILAVEWAERWTDAPERAWRVRITNVGESERQIAVSPPGS